MKIVRLLLILLASGCSIFLLIILLFFVFPFFQTSNYENTPERKLFTYDPLLLEPAKTHFLLSYKNNQQPPEGQIHYLLSALEKSRQKLMSDFNLSTYPSIFVLVFTDRQQYETVANIHVVDQQPLSGFFHDQGRVYFFIDSAEPSIDFSEFLSLSMHEMTHEIMKEKLNESFKLTPIWFLEGMAEYECRPESIKKERNQSVKSNKNKKYMNTLDTVDAAIRSRKSQDEMLLGYYTALYFVDHLIDKYGFEKVMQVVDSMPSTDKSFYDAFPEVTGDKLEDVYAGWFLGL